MSEKIRITFEVPRTLVEFIDKECKKKSTEVMKYNRSTFLRQLIIEAKDRKEDIKQEQNLNTKQQSNQTDNDYFDDLLNVSGYKK